MESHDRLHLERKLHAKTWSKYAFSLKMNYMESELGMTSSNSGKSVFVSFRTIALGKGIAHTSAWFK